MNKGRMFGYEKKPMPEGMTFFNPHKESSLFPEKTQQIDRSLSDALGIALQRALRERYARRTGVFAFPFRGTPFDLPVNLDEGSRLSSSFFQGRKNP